MSRRKQSRPKHLQEADEDLQPTLNDQVDESQDTSCSSADSRQYHEEPQLSPKCFPKFNDLNFYVAGGLTYSRSESQMQDERVSTPGSSTSRMEDIYNSKVKVDKYQAEEEVGQQQRPCHHQRVRARPLNKEREDDEMCAISNVFNTDFSSEDCNMGFFELNERHETDDLESDRSLGRGLNHLDDDLNEQLNGKHMPLKRGTIPGSILPFVTATASTNVKLASICSTDVAVAQITENNTFPTDVALLHTVLWNLKQQQFFQMHLLQQLQNQLLHATENSIPTPVAPIIVPTSLFCSSVMKESASDTSENQESSASIGSSSQISDRQMEMADAYSVPNNVTNNDHSDLQQTEFQINSTESCIKQKTPMLAMMDMLQENILLKGKGYVFDSNSTSTSEHCHSILPNAGNPFFKHSCRYCQKVFTSDSALQIHLRSHTGERPYRCNICGNRFSTKGNLKVHSMCHTEKYPNIHIDHSQDSSIVGPDFPRDMIPSATNSGDHFHSQPQMLVPLKHDTSSSSSNGFGPALDLFPTSFQLQSTLKPRVIQHPSGETLKCSTQLIQSHKDSMLTGGGIWMEPINFPARNAPVPSTLDAAPNRSLEDPQLIELLVTQEESPDKTSRCSMEISSIIVCSSSSSVTQSSPSPQSTSLPPLSLLSSMSTSLSAFANPPFSSPFFAHGETTASSLTSPHAYLTPFDFDSTSVYFRSSSLHSKHEDPLEQFMEVQKSETSKMEQLVKNIDKKLTDPNQCAICYRTLSCKSALQMHYRTHTGERPFRCKICGRAFTTKGNLKTHMGVHRVKPPVRMMHQCPVCHKQFTNALVLQQHIRMHTGELPKHIPYPDRMMIVSSPMNYIPFPGYPFFTPRFHQIRRPALTPPQLHLSSHQQLGHRSPFPSQMRESERYTKGYLTISSIEKEKKQLSKSAFSIDTLKDSSSIIKDRDNHEDYRSSKQIVQTEEDQTYTEMESSYADAAVSRVTSASLSDINDNNDGGEEAPNCQDIDITNQRNTVLHIHQSRSTPSPNSLHNTVTEEEGENEQKVEQGETQILDEKIDHRSDSSDESQQTRIVMKQRLDGNKILETHSRYLMFDPSQNCYSTSLMALEEKVMKINEQQHSIHTGVSHPLEQIERIIRRTECLPPSHVLRNQDSIYNVQTDNLNDRRQAEHSKQFNLISANCIMSRNHVDKLSVELMAEGNSFPSQTPIEPDLELSPQSFEATNGKPNTTCSICYKTFACKSALDIHYRSHTKERPFKCKLCDRAFSTKGNMKQHMMTHKGNNEHTNQVVFSSEGSCSSHSRSCPPEDKLNISKPVSESVISENSHRSKEDANEEIMSSNLESTSHHPTYDLHKPKMTTSTDEASAQSCQSPTLSRKLNLRHLCQVCQKPFSSASALQIHMRTHTGDKPFKCTICSKAFTTKGNLKVHAGTHMWNNGPSRRGRRMSVDGFASLAPRSTCSDFFGIPRRLLPPPPHDLYPFSFPGFSNSFDGSKLNEISVIQSISSRIAHLQPASTNEIITAHLTPLMKSHPYVLQCSSQEHSSSHMDSLITSRLNSVTSVESREKSDKLQCGYNGELDLSLKKSPSSMSSAHVSTGEKVLNSSWAWKTSCNHCSIVCSSPGALDLHMKTHTEWLSENNSPKPLLI